MGKNKAVFVCKECGYESNRWLGKCPSCGAWNSFVEYDEKKKGKGNGGFKFDVSTPPTPLDEIDFKSVKRFETKIGEFDRVLGGGIVPGAVILIGGEPGIGKSTLLLQVSYKLTKRGSRVLYSTSEESLQQISLRANRLNAVSGDILLSSEYSVNKIIKYAEDVKPG
ncbi:AAA family ATPase, partial [candidate division WOR-3 bacterium]|nr:AAA family ATPase [candidate division WOR-3 bacterium]